MLNCTFGFTVLYADDNGCPDQLVSLSHSSPVRYLRPEKYSVLRCVYFLFVSVWSFPFMSLVYPRSLLTCYRHHGNWCWTPEAECGTHCCCDRKQRSAPSLWADLYSHSYNDGSCRAHALQSLPHINMYLYLTDNTSVFLHVMEYSLMVFLLLQ